MLQFLQQPWENWQMRQAQALVSYPLAQRVWAKPKTWPWLLQANRGLTKELVRWAGGQSKVLKLPPDWALLLRQRPQEMFRQPRWALLKL
jgi:hypothetical protein